MAHCALAEFFVSGLFFFAYFSDQFEKKFGEMKRRRHKKNDSTKKQGQKKKKKSNEEQKWKLRFKFIYKINLLSIIFLAKNK